jgi:branched-chain amino acid transport system ATP-binding protein
MSETPLLNVSRLSKGFGGVPVLAGVNFSLRPGERLGLIGPNGAGKTTLINVITGGHAPDAGLVVFEGRNITSLAPHRRNRLGMARSFQILSLFPKMTVLENIRNALLRYSGLHVQFWRRLAAFQDLHAEAAHYAALVGLGQALDLRVDTLPYGEARRLDIALVLAQQPRLIILDEPAAGLSASETRDLVAVLKVTIGACALILVEHDMDVVYALADRIMVLDYGRVLAEGTPAEISTNEDVRRVYLGEAAG